MNKQYCLVRVHISVSETMRPCTHTFVSLLCSKACAASWMLPGTVLHVARYQYYMQLKSDVIEGKLPCTPEQAVLLAAYSVQGTYSVQTGWRLQYMYMILAKRILRTRQTVVYKYTSYTHTARVFLFVYFYFRRIR